MQLYGLRPTRLQCLWGSPGKNTGWIAMSFSRGSSWPRDQTGVSCIAGRFFTIWATWEALLDVHNHFKGCKHLSKGMLCVSVMPLGCGLVLLRCPEDGRGKTTAGLIRLLCHRRHWRRLEWWEPRRMKAAVVWEIQERLLEGVIFRTAFLMSRYLQFVQIIVLDFIHLASLSFFFPPTTSVSIS